MQRDTADFTLTFLGTGTSQGVPVIGCDCATCRSDDPRDRRLRASVYIETPECAFVVDTGPDFRTQCLRENIRRLDSILSSMPKSSVPARALDPKKPTAALLVGGYAGLGVHSLLTIQRLFPGYFQNFVFLWWGSSTRPPSRTSPRWWR
jgi:hypothetical protein